MAPALRWFLAGPWPVIGMFLLLAGSLVIMAEATQSSGHFHRWQWWVASFNGVLALALLALIGLSLSRLIQRLRHREAGSRLSLRMTAMFASFTLIPTAMVFIFSVWLISSGIDSWFDVGVDDTLNKALELSRTSVDMQMRERRSQVERLLQEPIDVSDPEAMVVRMHDLMVQTGAVEATLLDSSNKIIASQGEVPDILPDLPGEAQLQLLQESEESGFYMAQEEHPEHGTIVRILMQVPALSRELPLTDQELPLALNQELPLAMNQELPLLLSQELPLTLNREIPLTTRELSLTLQILYPVSEYMLGLTDSVEKASITYQSLLEQRTPLKYNLTFVMALAVLLGLLFAMWAALFSAQRILSPISELARGIEAVAVGEYSQRLPTGRGDELGQLVQSYNDMIERLANARYVAETRRLTIEQQHTYLHTVLEHLSSGVISVDDRNEVITANPAASSILDLDIERYIRQPISVLREEHPQLEPLWNLMDHQQYSVADLRRQLQINNELKVLHCHGAQLPKGAGYVVVFEDITDLQQAQRQAAWGEVARRLAHEIKNPLTPIRLSAERMQHRIQSNLAEEDSEILQRATQTIVRQVESMKTMIDEFSEYSADRFTPELLDLNALSVEVLDLYMEDRPKISIRTDLSETPAWIQGDPDRIRQLLHNLIKNALEAQEEQAEGTIILSTEMQEATVVLKVQDTGPGFAPEIITRAFEPYVTTKPTGNGLGLAVVYRITEDHQGRIRVYNDPAGGGCVEIEFNASPQSPQEVQSPAAVA
ncbi:MAG: ATP-binding protein [Gammaproteobacteria bacterium]|nr:ATP-binding protein [Gammaproteobacteria bacterium]MDE0612402.1 ATP-binding protein [Gammaproteobacteria bacterium]